MIGWVQGSLEEKQYTSIADKKKCAHTHSYVNIIFFAKANKIKKLFSMDHKTNEVYSWSWQVQIFLPSIWTQENFRNTSKECPLTIIFLCFEPEFLFNWRKELFDISDKLKQQRNMYT